MTGLTRSMNRFATCTALSCFSVVAGCDHALASGFMVRENSATAVGTADAGNGSRADGADTSFNNPAGMMRLSGNEVEFGTIAITPSEKFSGGASAFGTPIPGNNGGNPGRVAPIPSLYWVSRLSNRLKGGI